MLGTAAEHKIPAQSPGEGCHIMHAAWSQGLSQHAVSWNIRQILLLWAARGSLGDVKAWQGTGLRSRWDPAPLPGTVRMKLEET